MYGARLSGRLTLCKPRSGCGLEDVQTMPLPAAVSGAAWKSYEHRGPENPHAHTGQTFIL